MNIKELYWAAGFLEGEGSFSIRDRKSTKHGRSVDLKASQLNPEPLYRLRTFLGGAIYGPYMNRIAIKSGHSRPYMEWHLGGKNAAGAFMTLYVLMSDLKRRQITRALTIWKTVPVRGIGMSACKRGHEFDVVNTYSWRGHRSCRQCQRERNLAWIAKRKLAAQSNVIPFKQKETG